MVPTVWSFDYLAIKFVIPKGFSISTVFTEELYTH